MLIEILTPFLCFFIAEGVGFSGIIAAVTAGSRQAFTVRRLEKFEAEFATLKKSIWDMITVVFNSFIFILLGLSLPAIIHAVVLLDDYTLAFSIGVGLFATGVLLAVRFVGVALGARNIGEKDNVEKLRSWAILTLSGVKGTVSLATAFSLPLALYGGEIFEHRNFLLLVTACVIIFSLTITTVFLPIIAKPKRSKRRNSAYVRIVRDVIRTVEGSDSACATAVAINLRRRARQLEYEDLGDEQRKKVDVIKREFVRREVALLEKQRSSGEITDGEYVDCHRIISLIAVMQEGSLMRRYFNRLRFTFRLIGEPKTAKKTAAHGDKKAGLRIRGLFWENTGKVGTILGRKYGKDDYILARIIENRIDIATNIIERFYGESAGREFIEEYDREIKRCFALERQKLNEYIGDGRIGEDEADEIRVQINTLENYAIQNVQSDITARAFMSRKGARRHRSRK
jgi:CPA1 family monovalent cation:H+ antiporter